jgi:hypothetical protein
VKKQLSRRGDCVQGVCAAVKIYVCVWPHRFAAAAAAAGSEVDAYLITHHVSIRNLTRTRRQQTIHATMSINFLLFWGERNRALWQQLLVGEIEKSAERFALLEKLGAAPQELFVTAARA